MDFSQAYQKMEALVEVGKKLSAGIRLSEQIFELIYQQASERLGMKNLSIALYGEKTDTVRFVLGYSEGRKVDITNEIGWETRMGANGNEEEVIRTKRYLYLSKKEETRRRYFLRDTVPNSWLGIPMIVSNDVLGVIATYPYNDTFYRTRSFFLLWDK